MFAYWDLAGVRLGVKKSPLQETQTELLLAKGLRSPRDLTLKASGIDYMTYTGLGKQMLGGHKQNLVCTRTQEKGAVTPQETDPDLPVSVQETPAQAWANSGLMWG